MAVPKQRGGSSGRGGANHRDNIRGFRNSGGNVKPPKKGCELFVLVIAGSILLTGIAGAGIWQTLS